MSIAFDAAGHGDDSGFVSTISWTHVCTGSNRILVASVSNNLGVAYSSSDTMTYNGTSMTYVRAQNGSNVCIITFYILNPATGSHTITFTYNPGTNHRKSGASASYTGAKQSGQPDSSSGGTAASAASLTLSTTIVADNSWVVGSWANGNAMSAGTNTTERDEGSGAGNTSNTSIGDTNAAQTPAGSKSVQETSAGGEWAGNVLSIQPLVVANTLALAQGAYALTGFTLGLTVQHVLALAQGAYTYTGQAIAFVLALKWNDDSKSSSSMTNQSKGSSSSYVNGTKDSTTFNNDTLH